MNTLYKIALIVILGLGVSACAGTKNGGNTEEKPKSPVAETSIPDSSEEVDQPDTGSFAPAYLGKRAQNLSNEIDSFKSKTKELRKKIGIEHTLSPNKAHMLMTPELDQIDEDLDRMLESLLTYFDKSEFGLIAPKADIPFDTLEKVLKDVETKLASVQEGVKNIYEVISNAQEPIDLDHKIFFARGKYEIKSTINSRNLDKLIRSLRENIREVKADDPDKRIVVYYRIWGYADELPIKGELASELRGEARARSYTTRSQGACQCAQEGTGIDCSTRLRQKRGEGEDEYLNRILSHKRANSVSQYLQRTIQAALRQEGLRASQYEIVCDFEGKGQNYPKGVPFCPEDCPRRRISTFHAVVKTGYKM